MIQAVLGNPSHPEYGEYPKVCVNLQIDVR